MRKTLTYTLSAAVAVMATWLLSSCIKDELWREHYNKDYTAGLHISVSADSVAAVDMATAVRTATGESYVVPMPGYLTIFSSHYYTDNQGNIIYKERACIEAMHNGRVNVRVVEGSPASILSLTCTIGGLASRFDIARTQLLGPSARVTNVITMQGDTGSALFRLLGAVAEHQPLVLCLTQTDGRQQAVEVDATPLLQELRPQPFELNIDGNASTDEHVEVETTVNIDIDLRIIPSDNGSLRFTATLTNWSNEQIDINTK